MPCTTILVGKHASYDGSTLVARNEDSGAGSFMPKKFLVVLPENQPKIYKSVLSHVEIPLPDNPMAYTAMPNAIDDEGLWAACGVNQANVSMTATETITSNERVLSADPLVTYHPAKGKAGEAGYVPERVGGIGEEDMVTLVLPYIHSAREGVLRLGQLLEDYGTYEMNGIGFQDVNEIWWLETIGGHHWIAKRVPDDAYVVMPNQLGIDAFDLEDALGKQENHLCSADLREFIGNNHLNLSFDGSLNPRFAFGSHSDADHVYNTPRAWVIQRYFNPRSNTWDGLNADFRPDSDYMPWSRIPEQKITVEDIKYTLSHHYQGTPYDCYGKHNDPRSRGSFRPIGVNRNNFLALVQIRPYMPEALRSIEWLALGSNVFNAFVPFYVNIKTSPAYVADTTGQVTTDSFYWTNRIIGALADPHFSLCASHIERYQMAVQSKGHTLIKQYDQAILGQTDRAGDLCQEANQAIADMVKSETNALLDKVLYEASCQMKNGFARSDA